MQMKKQAIFMVGEEEYGLDIMDINIIEKFMDVEPVASFPRNLKGVIRLRGDVIPVYSLRRKFGLEDTIPDADYRFVITKSNGFLMAIEVDKVIEIAQVNEEDFNKIPPIVNNKVTAYMKSVINWKGRLIINLDPDHILSEEELKSVQTMKV